MFSVLMLFAVGPRGVSAQFLCSGPPKDGQSCAGDEDCLPGGVCVIGQGVCVGGDDDAQICDCPSSTCPGVTATCSDPLTSGFGTCNAGPFSGASCGCNCAGSTPCTPTQKVCLSGGLKGFSCVNDSQCAPSVCRSTAKVCIGGEFDSFACVDNSDCPGPAPTPAGT